MAKEPEQMLEQERVATSDEELCPNSMVEEQERHADDKRWQGHEEHEYADEHGPGEEWHLHPRDTRCTHREDRGNEVHTTQRR